MLGVGEYSLVRQLEGADKIGPSIDKCRRSRPREARPYAILVVAPYSMATAVKPRHLTLAPFTRRFLISVAIARYLALF